MKRQFSLGTVFRMSDKSLLRRFFEEMGADATEVPWDKIGRKNIDILQKFFDELPPSERDQAEVVLRHVHALACEKGIEALGEAADTHQADESWGEHYLSEMGLYSKALAAWLYHRDIFETAAQYFEADSRTWWRKRLDLPKVTPNFDTATRNNLEQDIEAFLKQKQGRGCVCTVENLCRPSGVFYFIAHPDDYVRDTLVHDEEKLLVHQTIRQTFEIAFAYDSVRGTSELSANLSKPVKETLEEIFLRNILNVTPDEDEKKPFDLSVLLDPNFSLETHPEDHLRVHVTSLTLLWPGRAELSVTPKGPISARVLARSGVNIKEYPLELATVTKAKFRFEFLVPGKGRPKTLTFEIGPPDSCTLGNQQPDRVKTAYKYLIEWGIVYENATETKNEESAGRVAVSVAHK